MRRDLKFQPFCEPRPITIYVATVAVPEALAIPACNGQLIEKWMRRRLAPMRSRRLEPIRRQMGCQFLSGATGR